MELVSDEAEDARSADDNSNDKKCSTSELNYMDTEPGPSNVRSTSTRTALHSSVDSISGISTSHSPSEQDASPAPTDNYDADADFPRWMRLTQPLRFPYIAQIGDEVVYFRQGRFTLPAQRVKFYDFVESLRRVPLMFFPSPYLAR